MVGMLCEFLSARYRFVSHSFPLISLPQPPNPTHSNPPSIRRLPLAVALFPLGRVDGPLRLRLLDLLLHLPHGDDGHPPDGLFLRLVGSRMRRHLARHGHDRRRGGGLVRPLHLRLHLLEAQLSEQCDARALRSCGGSGKLVSSRPRESRSLGLPPAWRGEGAATRARASAPALPFRGIFSYRRARARSEMVGDMWEGDASAVRELRARLTRVAPSQWPPPPGPRLSPPPPAPPNFPAFERNGYPPRVSACSLSLSLSSPTCPADRSYSRAAPLRGRCVQFCSLVPGRDVRWGGAPVGVRASGRPFPNDLPPPRKPQKANPKKLCTRTRALTASTQIETPFVNYRERGYY
jgi:hypothetical protein